MLASSEAKKLASVHAEAEKYALNIHCLALVLCRILKDFLPLEASPQVRKDAFLNLKCVKESSHFGIIKIINAVITDFHINSRSLMVMFLKG